LWWWCGGCDAGGCGGFGCDDGGGGGGGGGDVVIVRGCCGVGSLIATPAELVVHVCLHMICCTQAATTNILLFYAWL
jgi:hypothetical protein